MAPTNAHDVIVAASFSVNPHSASNTTPRKLNNKTSIASAAKQAKTRRKQNFILK
jgi:hypothetical protein